MDRKSEFMEQFDDLVVCAICSETYTSPKKLPCNHTFCLKCLEVYAKHGQSESKVCCPLCRNEATLRGAIHELPDNKLFLCLVDIKNSVSTSLGNYGVVACSIKSCRNSEVWHCTVCDDGFCKTCVSRHDKSHQVIKMETYLQKCLSSEINNQLKRVQKQLAKEGKDFDVAVSVAEDAIGKKCEELKVLLDQHREQLLREVKLKKVDHLKELNDLQKEIENLLALSVAPACRLKKENEDMVGNLKKHNSPLSIKLADYCETKVEFIPRNIRQELLSFGSLSNILGKIALTGQLQVYDADSSNLRGKFDCEMYEVRAKNSGVIVGIAALGERIYVVHSLASCVGEYDHVDFRLLNSLTIPGLSNPQDMASCEKSTCLYVTDSYDDSVHRFEVTSAPLESKSKKWSMADQPLGVSVSYTTANVFVTCLYAQKLYEFSSSGDVLHCIVLHPDILHPHHALQVSSGKIILSHGFWSTDPLHRICVVDGHGRSSFQYGQQPGSATGQLNQPVHLATISSNDLIFVADSDNCRIQLLDASLCRNLMNIMDSSGQMKSPHRICLDTHHGFLYAAENTLQNRIFVFNLSKILG